MHFKPCCPSDDDDGKAAAAWKELKKLDSLFKTGLG